MKKMEEQDIVQAIPTISVFDELKDEVTNLFEKNSQEHGKFSKDIEALDKKLDEMLETQRREKRREEVKKFVEESNLGFEVFAGKIAIPDSSNDDMRLWIKIPNKEKTDFEYIVLADIPQILNYYHLKIFEGKTYNLPFFSPRGSVLISVSATAKADGNGFVPHFFHRFWFDIDSRKVTLIKDFSDLGDYFTAIETISGRNLSKIYDKLYNYIDHPTGKNVLLSERLYAYDLKLERYYTWDKREER